MVRQGRQRMKCHEQQLHLLRAYARGLRRQPFHRIWCAPACPFFARLHDGGAGRAQARMSAAELVELRAAHMARLSVLSAESAAPAGPAAPEPPRGSVHGHVATEDGKTHWDHVLAEMVRRRAPSQPAARPRACGGHAAAVLLIQRTRGRRGGVIHARVAAAADVDLQ